MATSIPPPTAEFTAAPPSPHSEGPAPRSEELARIAGTWEEAPATPPRTPAPVPLTRTGAGPRVHFDLD